MFGKLFVVFLIALLAFQHCLFKKRVPSVSCAWLVIDRRSLFTLSNSFDNRGIWPPAALALTFAIAKSFFGALYNTAIIGLS